MSVIKSIKNMNGNNTQKRKLPANQVNRRKKETKQNIKKSKIKTKQIHWQINTYTNKQTPVRKGAIKEKERNSGCIHHVDTEGPPTRTLRPGLRSGLHLGTASRLAV